MSWLKSPADDQHSRRTWGFLWGFIPGAIYTWAFERIAGRWGIGLTDRVYRFVGISALYQVVLAPATYHIWLSYLRSGAPNAHRWPLWLWFASIAYLGVPAVAGTVLALRFRFGGSWAKKLVGATAAPTAWDAVFSNEPSGYVLMRLKSGRWVGGAYKKGSHVGGYPEPADIYLVQELHVDQTAEDFQRDSRGRTVAVSDYGLLVRWDEVEYLEIAS